MLAIQIAKQAVISIALSSEWIDLLNGCVAHHLFDGIDHRKHGRKSEQIDPCQLTVEVGDGKRQRGWDIFHV